MDNKNERGKKAQEITRKYIPCGRNLSGELITERREEASDENRFKSSLKEGKNKYAKMLKRLAE